MRSSFLSQGSWWRLQVFGAVLAMSIYCVASVAEVQADNNDALPNNVFTKTSKGLSKAGALQGMAVRDYVGANSGTVVFPHTDPNAECPPDDEECQESDFPKFDEAERSRTNGWNYYGASIGMASEMKSTYHKEQILDEYLDGDLTLTYITLGLTEPAVAAGVNHSIELASGDMQARMLGEQLFFQQLAVMPDVGQQIGQAHINCIRKLMKDGQPWVKAQAMCIGDSTERFGTEDIKFTDPGGSPLLSFADDPNWDDENDRQEIRLTDYLLKQDADADEDFKELKSAFKEMIGDVVFSLDDQSGGEAPAGTRELTYRREKADVSLIDAYRKTSEESFEALKEVMFEYCLHVRGSSGSAPSLDLLTVKKRNQSANTYHKGDFWSTFLESSDNKKTIAKLGMQGYSLTPVLAQGLLHLHLSGDSGGNVGPEQACAAIGGANSQYDYKKVLENPVKAGIAARAFLFYANRIGIGRVMTSFRVAKQFLRKLSIGPFSMLAREVGMQMIDETLGGVDPEEFHNKILSELIDFQEDILARKHGETGRGGRGMKTLFSEGKSPSSHSPLGGGN